MQWLAMAAALSIVLSTTIFTPTLKCEQYVYTANTPKSYGWPKILQKNMTFVQFRTESTSDLILHLYCRDVIADGNSRLYNNKASNNICKAFSAYPPIKVK